MNITLCMIVKNEEKNIRKSIESVKNIVDEIIVVDTGSNDNTVKIAREFNAKIYFFKWIDDFAKARNYALSKVSKKSDWIIFLDADEYFDKESSTKIKEYLKQAEKINCEFIQSRLINIQEKTNKVKSITKNIRIFKNKNYIYYEGIIHEQIVSEKEKKRIANVELNIIHTGYSTDIIKEKNKVDRNLKLLYKELEEEPDNLNIKFFIAETLLLNKQFNKANNYIEDIINNDDGNIDGKIAGIYERAYYYKLFIMYNLEEKSNKIIEFYNICIKKFSTFPDYDEIFGMYCYKRGKYNLAIRSFVNCLDKISKFDSIIESLSVGHKQNIRIKLIDSLLKLQKKQEAVKYIISILKEEKYDEQLLQVLMNLFSECESAHDIYNFFGKLYNYSIEKDKLLLLKVSEKLNNNELFSLFCNKFNDVKKLNYEDKLKSEKIVDQKEKNEDIGLLVELGRNESVNNKEKALEYFEKAYSLLINEKMKQNNKEVYLPYVAMLYHFKKFKKIESVVSDILNLYKKESVELIDLYYYLGITEVELNKFEECIQSLNEYFKLITKIRNHKIESKEDKIYYTLNLTQNAYYNLAKSYSYKKDKEKFLTTIYKIEDLRYLKLRLMEIIDLFLNNQYYNELINYYEEVLKSKLRLNQDLFIKMIDYKKNSIENYDILKEIIDKHFNLHNYIYEEFEEYKRQVKQTIKELIDKRDIFNAESIIKEYEEIVPNDLEILNLKNKLNLLKN